MHSPASPPGLPGPQGLVLPSSPSGHSPSGHSPSLHFLLQSHSPGTPAGPAGFTGVVPSAGERPSLRWVAWPGTSPDAFGLFIYLYCDCSPHKWQNQISDYQPMFPSFIFFSLLSPLLVDLCRQSTKQDKHTKKMKLKACMHLYLRSKDSTLRDTSPYTAPRTVSRGRETEGRCLRSLGQAGRGTEEDPIRGHPCGL